MSTVHTVIISTQNDQENRAILLHGKATASGACLALEKSALRGYMGEVYKIMNDVEKLGKQLLGIQDRGCSYTHILMTDSNR